MAEQMGSAEKMGAVAPTGPFASIIIINEPLFQGHLFFRLMRTLIHELHHWRVINFYKVLGMKLAPRPEMEVAAMEYEFAFLSKFQKKYPFSKRTIDDEISLIKKYFSDMQRAKKGWKFWGGQIPGVYK